MIKQDIFKLEKNQYLISIIHHLTKSPVVNADSPDAIKYLLVSRSNKLLEYYIHNHILCYIYIYI